MPSPTQPDMMKMLTGGIGLPTDMASLTQKAEQNVPILQRIPDDVISRIMAFGFNFLMSALIIAVGWIIAAWVMNRSYKAFSRARINDTTAQFLSSAVRFTIIFTAFIAAIIQMGVPSQTLVTIVGALVVALGLGLKDTLTNVAAGIMLLVNRPFKAGDYVEIGDSKGTVRRINLFQTEINTLNNVRIFVPNMVIWDSPVNNYSHNHTRMVDLIVGLDYSHKVDECLDAIRAAIKAEPLVLDDPEPFVGIDALADSSVNFTIRVWIKTSDFKNVRFGLLGKIKDEVEARGLSIPFPQRVLHMAAGSNADLEVSASNPGKSAAKPSKGKSAKTKSKAKKT